MNGRSPREFLMELAQAAIDAAAPRRCVRAHLPLPPARGRTVVVGGGKAAAAMAHVVEECWPAEAPLSGVVLTRYGHGCPCRRITVLEAAHPVPDEAGIDAAGQVLAAVRNLAAEDLVLVLLSGGASALLALPAPGISLRDKQAVNRALLRSGASIRDINCVRKHLSAIKGGRLALACSPARVHTLAISDVPGDDPSVIGSGPTVADPTSFAEARAVLARYSITVPEAIRRHLADATDETPKPDDPRIQETTTVVVASARDALSAAAETARASGVTPVILGDDLQGEASTLGAEHGALALRVALSGTPCRPPCVLLSGGETTVTVRGPGRGGRNTEYLLAVVAALRGHPAISALAIDTDGIDGTEENAGAIAQPDTPARAAAQGLDPASFLGRNDAYSFFHDLGDLITTGPTRTNVNDFRALYISSAHDPVPAQPLQK